MKNSILFFSLIILTSCQSQLTPSDALLSEGIPVKMAHAVIVNNSLGTDNLVEKGWYSDLNEMEGFENYEEENGIFLGKNLSVGTYVDGENPQEKLIILEKMQLQNNGEANFQKLDMLKINLERHQFLTTEFCQLENNDKAAILAVYESGSEIAYAKNFIKAWEVNLETLKLESVSTKSVRCLFVF